MKNIKFITPALFLLFICADKSSAETFWLQAHTSSVVGKGYSFPYPRPMIEYDGTVEGKAAASIEIAKAVCGKLLNEFRPGSCNLEVEGGFAINSVPVYAYCYWNSNCTSSKESARINFNAKACPDGTYPDSQTTGITCETTEPQYCPDGNIYNNVAGTCDIPPPPPMPPNKNLGDNCPSGPSPLVAEKK